MNRIDKTKQSIIANLHWNEKLVEIARDDIVVVSRNTKGNLLPATEQEMTLDEAIAYGAWSTVAGTMTASVTLSPRVYEHPVAVTVKNGFAYGIYCEEQNS